MVEKVAILSVPRVKVEGSRLTGAFLRCLIVIIHRLRGTVPIFSPVDHAWNMSMLWWQGFNVNPRSSQ